MVDKTNEGSRFVYRPPNVESPHNIEAKNATLCVKFAQRRFLIDEYWINGGTKWSRFKIKLKHPTVYSKRGIRNIFRKIKRLFVKPKSIQPYIH